MGSPALPLLGQRRAALAPQDRALPGCQHGAAWGCLGLASRGTGWAQRETGEPTAFGKKAKRSSQQTDATRSGIASKREEPALFRHKNFGNACSSSKVHFLPRHSSAEPTGNPPAQPTAAKSSQKQPTAPHLRSPRTQPHPTRSLPPGYVGGSARGRARWRPARLVSARNGFNTTTSPYFYFAARSRGASGGRPEPGGHSAAHGAAAPRREQKSRATKRRSRPAAPRAGHLLGIAGPGAARWLRTPRQPPPARSAERG